MSRTSGCALATPKDRPAQVSMGRSLGMSPNANTSAGSMPCEAHHSPSAAALVTPPCADLCEPRGARIGDDSPITDDLLDHAVEALGGHAVTPGEHLARQRIEQLLERCGRQILRRRALVAEAPFPPETQSVLNGKRNAWQRLPEVFRYLPDDSGRHTTLEQDLPGAHVVDEGSVAAEDDPVVANEIDKLMQPPRGPSGHQDHLDARQLNRGQRCARPLRTRAVTAQERAIEVCGHESRHHLWRHCAVTPPTTKKRTVRVATSASTSSTMASVPAKDSPSA